MAKKKDENVNTPVDTKNREDIDKENETFARSLIKSFNKDEQIAYSLAYDDNPTDVKEYISTGSTILDYMISNRRNGGVPVGKITEISGESSSGKSLMVCHIIANTQKKGGVAALIDTENAANPDFMKRLGVDLTKLIYLQPETIEETFEAIEKIIIKTREKFPNKDRPVTIVWDSIAATPPQVEIEGDYDPNSRIGVAAKAMSKAMRKLTQTVGKEFVTLVFTNQLRAKIGVMFGDPNTTPHGKAVPFHATVRVRLDSGKMIQNNEKEAVGISGTAKVIKTRLGPPFRKARYNVMFDHGIDDELSWYEFLHEKGLIEKGHGSSSITLDGKEYSFRHSSWKKQLQDETFRNGVLNLLEKSLVKIYDEASEDMEVDPENLMEVEEYAEEV